ncbi:quinate 5-dehydrogenase [Desulfallas thermosapovorans]|uniref:Quinate 5-dehydrogenase n=1 Tax=Desulfallas thermosapovorans DSM 6562 TaxID=1121431 RepID=A0A5S4ZTX5_9FIRM|nr:quinate 5-dehydrogenase [Desulfallas thermosapovorans]TYO96146.1 hypothetical protein LX24_01094 [Desulfallas thermosapovorans DSM 6562]
MKRVVSVSLGSSRRDHQVQVELLGEQFEISRLGMDGNFEQAMAKLQQLDGQVDAIGLGGIDIYVYAGNKRYAFKDGLKLMEAVKITPVVDGSGLKNTLEREVVTYLLQNTNFIKKGTRVLMVSAVDRFGMAEAFAEAQCDVTFGDLIFAAGIPYPIKTVQELEETAARLLPEMTKLPFHMLYPTGKKQESRDEEKAQKFAQYYHDAEIIAGDFHFIKRYLPDKLNGQIIITNTTTAADIDLLRQSGASCLVTTTPVFEGRSFGTNVIEGVLVALLGKSWEEITPDEYRDIINKLNFKPRIIEMAN